MIVPVEAGSGDWALEEVGVVCSGHVKSIYRNQVNVTVLTAIRPGAFIFSVDVIRFSVDHIQEY